MLESQGYQNIQAGETSDEGIKFAYLDIHENYGSILELAELIKEVVGFKGALQFDASKPDGVMQKFDDAFGDAGPPAEGSESIQRTQRLQPLCFGRCMEGMVDTQCMLKANTADALAPCDPPRP